MKSQGRGFTLIEMLVVVAIIAALASILFPVFASARVAAKRSVCLSNMRQLGLGTTIYADDWDGEFPESSHTAEGTFERSWIHTLRPYLGNVDDIRFSPADPFREQRKANDGTSYVFNEYVVVPGPGSVTNLHAMPFPARTHILFTISDESGWAWTQDHTHSRN